MGELEAFPSGASAENVKTSPLEDKAANASSQLTSFVIIVPL